MFINPNITKIAVMPKKIDFSQKPMGDPPIHLGGLKWQKKVFP